MDLKLNSKQVAMLLCVHPNTVINWRWLTKITGRQHGPKWETGGVGRRIRYSSKTVKAFMETPKK